MQAVRRSPPDAGLGVSAGTNPQRQAVEPSLIGRIRRTWTCTFRVPGNGKRPRSAELKATIEKQIKLQEETNSLLRNLITVLQASGQATAELTEAIIQLGPEIILPPTP